MSALASVRLESAEQTLALDVRTWRTDVLVDLSGPARWISPYQIPESGRHAYSVIWRALDMTDATDVLKALINEALEERQWATYDGICPACGAEGLVTDYDWGTYSRVRHARALAEDTKGYPYTFCYSGPDPLPPRYEP